MAETAHVVDIRPLEEHDLDAVTALDRQLVGPSRRAYFERRRASAIRDPRSHLQIAATDGSSGLVGYMLARITSGEYGRTAPTVLLESMGVAPPAQRSGIGGRMLSALEHRAGAHGAKTVVTQVDWRNHAMLRFVAATGFLLAPRMLLERKVARMPLPATDEEVERAPARVRNLRAEDFDGVVRVDRRITGRDRSDYFRRKFDEALHESALRVSLVVEDDGFVVGFAMARVDGGDFGRLDPTASLDSIGIDPGFSGKGFARDTMAQMIDNLSAIHVEALETEVAYDHLELARFLYAFGFRPSQRLVFQAQCDRA